MTVNHGMDSAQSKHETRPRVLLQAEVETHALSCMTRDQIAHYRRRPELLPEGWAPVQPSTLRYSDEQTIAALAAVVKAIGQIGQAGRGRFEQWGVVAAPRFLGRANLTVALNRFGAEGVWGVSPHLIPHFALHSQTGTLSLALGIHGPNLGIGGGLYSATEGLLAALTWLQSGVVPGVWVVFSGWYPELIPDREGDPIGELECQALALALVPANSPQVQRPRLRLAASEVAGDAIPPDISLLANRLGGSPANSGADDKTPHRQILILHESHADAPTARPHFFGEAHRGSQPLTVFTDLAGRVHLELLTPVLEPVGEVGDGR
jgi:hypothetical protein